MDTEDEIERRVGALTVVALIDTKTPEEIAGTVLTVVVITGDGETAGMSK